MARRAEQLVEEVARIVGDRHVLVEDDLKVAYETDWTGRFSGSARCVVRPADTRQTAEVLRLCHAAKTPVVVQGGNTGLVGGSVPGDGEVLLSMTRLQDLEEVDALAAQVTAGAGVTLAALQAHASAAGLDYPVDIAARQTATVGGMIATNAGGIRVIKYGPTRHQIVGIEAVTMDGRVLSRMSGLVKDNTGYDLASLIVGSEGTLAVVTRARFQLVPKLDHRVVGLLAVPDVGAAQHVLARLRRGALDLEAAEYFTRSGLELVREVKGLAAPFSASHPAYLLVESAGQEDLTERMSQALADAPELLDAAVATDGPGRARLWELREAHTEAIAMMGTPIKLDVSLPGPAMTEFVDEVGPLVAKTVPDATTIIFGHLGDGNLHVNVLGADPNDDTVDDAVLRLVIRLGGSISAEHGIGRAKLTWLPMYRDGVDRQLTAGIKRAFDPDGLLNPGVLTPAFDQ